MFIRLSFICLEATALALGIAAASFLKLI